MRFINFAIVRFSIFLALGILTSRFYPISVFLLPYLLALLFGVFLFWFFARNQLIQKVFFGIATYLSFFAIGYVSYQMRLPEFEAEHYSHLEFDDTPEIIQLKIEQPIKPDKFNLKYFATVLAVNGSPKKGKILLNISKDSLQKSIIPDDIILVYAPILEIPKPLNPHQFDYSEYMRSMEIYGQLRVSEKTILKTRKGTSTLLGTAQNFRASLVEKLQKTKLKTDERAIIQALVLGEKRDIDKNLYNDYAAAGAVHILAVSGLHVGILYFIFVFLFKIITRWKYGIFLHSVIIVVLLWGFAVLSGLSPSVTRAVTMFTFFAMAKLINRESNSLNTLFLSFLTLLIINPLWLFKVGFQFSYLAVFFIVWLLPIFLKIGYSKYKLLRNAWGIVSVTICAQIGVFPLSLYYFHQFPGLFLITNIVVLPFLAILMCGGILIVLLASLNSLPDWLAEVYNYLLEALNDFIHFIASQDAFLLKGIHFSAFKVVGFYLLIIAMAFLFKKVNYKRLMASLVAISLLIAVYIYDEFRIPWNELWIFQKSKHTSIGYKNGKNFILFKKDSATIHSDSYPIHSYKTAINISNYSEDVLPKIFQYKKKNILVLDSLGLFPKKKNIHTLIITNSPRINLNRIIDSLKPTQVIADGSNYFSYVNQWEKTCKLKKLPFYHTAKQGAFSIK
ncbi:ComEC/Rec2 family competence protein [Aequorivita capsosiphonis]|uniref:ComEC/Rec2 family competence protein n=1 Tax=Aequorivita capsosiphonis TaxID=487317 RepID=UPI0004229C89|nr:ComEC/Rec2 family competence protein [Aequorivita capsosiphonis]